MLLQSCWIHVLAEHHEDVHGNCWMQVQVRLSGRALRERLRGLHRGCGLPRRRALSILFYFILFLFLLVINNIKCQ